MIHRSARYGGLSFLVALAIGVQPSHGGPAPLPSRTLEIEYVVNDEALPLDSVELWFRSSDSKQWRSYGFDDDRQSPVVFDAPTDGQFEFVVVVTNAAGGSSATPNESTLPQQVALIDTTPPVVQLHEPRVTAAFGRPVLQLRWTALDPLLPPRPVEVLYRAASDQPWIAATGEPIANTGALDWAIPADVLGPVALVVRVTDLAGHRSESEVHRVELASTSDQQRRKLVTHTAEWPLSRSPKSTGHGVGDSRGRQRAVQQFAEALRLRDAGKNREAIAHLREAIKSDPQMTDAFAEMGSLFYRIGDFDNALGAFDAALGNEPQSRDALRGAAMVFRQKKDYASAAERLRRILRYDPQDGEVWMNLGDIAVFQGDEALAHECYQRASQEELNPPAVTQEAQKRLTLMAEVSRTFGQDGL
jgi:Tfp pilus assembly protein PilF